jgi:hypothetical protein
MSARRGIVLVAGCLLAGVSLLITTSQRGTLLPGPGQRGRSSGPRPLRYTDATLIVDLTRAGDTAPIWHGVYHCEAGSGAKLLEMLPEGVKKLLGKYPTK